MVGSLLPQFLQLALPELIPAGGGAGDHGHVELAQLTRLDPRVGKRPVGSSERHPRHVVGLQQQPLRQVLGRREPAYLAGQPHPVLGRVEASDRRYPERSAERLLPVLLDPESDGRGDAQAGDDGGHRRSPGRVSTMALWNPPNPLPTVSAVRTCCSLATSGT